MTWWSSKHQSGISTVLDSVAYWHVLLTHLPYYSCTRLSYRTRSFAHPCVSCFRTSISAYRTRSFSQVGISRLHPRILTSLSASLLSSGYYCVTLSPCSILFFASRDNPVKVAQSCFYIASWRHHASLLHPTPSYPFSPAQTLNIGRNATYCATVACRPPI